jgi:CHAD domain-containing protein
VEAPTGSESEVEWQLEAQDFRPVQRWIERTNADAGREVRITSNGTINQVDTYVDTEDRRLDRAGYSVRLRRARGQRPEATLKSLDPIGDDALRIRLELAEELDEDEPSAIARAPGPVGERVRALIGSRKLVPLFDVQTRRRVFPLVAEGTPSGDLLLDETAVRTPAGEVLSRLRRVEVEVPESSVDAVAPLVRDLQAACGLHPAVLSKYQAALVASGEQRAGAEEFGETAIAPTDAIGHVALATLRRHFAVMRAKEPGTRIGDDIEELHDMRVATRRLRAAIAFFGAALPAEAERLVPELAWIGRTIGGVRDLDVQLEQLDEWRHELADDERNALDPLRALLVHERAGARADMLIALDSRRYETFVRRFGSMLRSRSGARTRPAREAALELVEDRHRRLQKALRRVRRNPEPANLHDLRIKAKRFRYALEFLSDVYPSATGRLVKRTVALQDLLGAHQDGHVAIERLHRLAAEHGLELGAETVFAMGGVAERYRRTMADTASQVEGVSAPLVGKPWRRFQRTLEAHAPPPPPESPASGDDPPEREVEPPS